MSLIQAEIDVANQALDRIAAGNITLAAQSDVKGLACNIHFVPTRDALLRSSEFNFSCARAELSLIYNMTLDTAPGPTAWIVGDTITGIASDATATILSVISAIEYELAYTVGTFEAGETITNGTVESVVWQGIPVYSGTEPVIWYEDTDQIVCGAGYPVVAEVAPVFGYDHQYVLPADFMRLRSRDSIYQYRHKHAIEGNRLLTNHDHKHILYVKKVTDPLLWDSLFTELFVLKLALKLANPLAGIGSATMKAEIKEELKYAESKARMVSFAEDNSTGHESFYPARYGR